MVGGKLNLCCYPGSLPRGGEASCLLSVELVCMCPGRDADVCCVALPGCWCCCSVHCQPCDSGGSGDASGPGAYSRGVTLAGLVARAQNLDPPGDFREREWCGCRGEITDKECET